MLDLVIYLSPVAVGLVVVWNSWVERRSTNRLFTFSFQAFWFIIALSVIALPESLIALAQAGLMYGASGLLLVALLRGEDESWFAFSSLVLVVGATFVFLIAAPLIIIENIQERRAPDIRQSAHPAMSTEFVSESLTKISDSFRTLREQSD